MSRPSVDLASTAITAPVVYLPDFIGMPRDLFSYLADVSRLRRLDLTRAYPHYNGHERYTLTMHESIPPDSLLATRLAADYYTATPLPDKFTGAKPSKPESADEAAWEAYFDLREEFSNARRDWRVAGEPAYLAACVAQREDRQQEFRADLIAALGLQAHYHALALVLEAENVAKESAAAYASGRDTDYDDDAPMNSGDLDYAADIAARFAAILT